MSGKPVEILLVRENGAARSRTEQTLRHARLNSALHVVGGGGAAIEFLKGAGEHSSAGRPDLVVLDLDLPVPEGREFVTEIKTDIDIKTIPVVVLMNKRKEEDFRRYNLHSNLYAMTPGDLELFLGVQRVPVPAEETLAELQRH